MQPGLSRPMCVVPCFHFVPRVLFFLTNGYNWYLIFSPRLASRSERSLKWDLCLRLPLSMCINVPPQQKCQQSSKQQQESEAHNSRRRPSAFCLTRCCQVERRWWEWGRNKSSDKAPLRGQEKSPLQQVCRVTKPTGGAGELTCSILKYLHCIWIITSLGRCELHLSRLFSRQQ